MSNMERVSTRSDTGNREFDRLMRDLRAILSDGVDHGFFACEISISTPKSGRREILISAGKSHKYFITSDDQPL